MNQLTQSLPLWKFFSANDGLRVFIFYPMSALMTLFFSILRNPESEHAIDDVELLAMSSRIIHNMPIQKMNQADTEKLQQVDVFVRELCRLSYSAIQQSQRNVAGH